MTTITSPSEVEALVLVHPGIEESRRSIVARTPGITSLTHARIGIVDNGKWNAGKLLDGVREQLVERHSMAVGPSIHKQHYNRDLTEAELAELQEGCDVALAAIGDCGSCTSYTIRDMVNLERIGIPTVAFVTEPFRALAESYAGVLGLADGRIQTIEHPLYGIPDEALLDRILVGTDPTREHLAADSP